MKFLSFAMFSLRQLVSGGRAYYAWLGFLGLLIAVGLMGYSEQAIHGHIVSNLRDPVPWGLFIGTYAFFVGVAAAAVALVVPGYVYHWEPIKEIVILGEIIAISAVIMCILFVLADLGHPERFWHLLPIVGSPNLPSSMIAMNVLILNAYLVLTLIIVTYFLYCSYVGRPYNKLIFMSLIFVSIPAAISIHTTTALIFNVLPARPYWNSAILVPRFIATALCAGPALMVLTFQILRSVARIDIKDQALQKIAEMMTIVMFVNLLLFVAEVITEYRSATHHSVHIQYYFEGLDGDMGLAGWAWFGVVCNVVAFVLFVVPRTRKNFATMNLGCILVFFGVFIEKGIGLILPALTPGILGEIYEYSPAGVELMILVGVAGAGTLVFTLLAKVAIPIALTGASEEGDRLRGVTRLRRNRGMRWGAALMLAAAGLLAAPGPPWAQAQGRQVEDSCVECHRNPDLLVTNKKLYEYFQEWQTSVHRQEGIGCSDCHGGDPSAPEKQAAHGGEMAESAERSAVSYANIPGTCGECHDDILEGYRQSPHFEHLVRKQEAAQGPNCVTCHGSINSAALNVNTVREACARCHNREKENHPEIPDEAKLLLNKFLSIHRYYRYVSIRGDPVDTREFLTGLDDQIHQLSVDWHTFDLCRIERRTRVVLDLLREKRSEVRKRREAAAGE